MRRGFTSRDCSSNIWKSCCISPSKLNYSPYGMENLSVPIGCEQRLSYQTQPFSKGYSIDGSLAPMQPILNKQTSHVQYLSIPSRSCIQMITNAIVTRVRSRVSQEDINLLCCCLPSLIRPIMCKSPWLTPNDVIQWLSADILVQILCESHIAERSLVL
jgi:hypothetical protein